MKCATSSVRATTLVITEDSTQDITDCNASAGFIPANDLVKVFGAGGERFSRALVIVVMIELSRLSKRSLISSRASEKPSWMSFMSAMSAVTETFECEGVSEICEAAGVTARGVANEAE